jgi:hypothetical protein
MSIEKIERLADKTIIRIHEPVRYGEPDRYRDVVVSHDPEQLSQIPHMSHNRFSNPLNDSRRGDWEEMVTVEVEAVGTIVFVKQFDTEWSSATYRSGSHSMAGPYLLCSDD